jgi:LysR family glycine cleavage system transcriptional activator
MALEAAMDGFGVALARTAHVVEELAAGYLVRLFDIPCPSNVAYYLVCPQGHEDRPTISAFRRWILDEVASEGKRPEAARATG